jgi:hypothetical protein
MPVFPQSAGEKARHCSPGRELAGRAEAVTAEAYTRVTTEQNTSNGLVRRLASRNPLLYASGAALQSWVGT